MNKRIAVRHCDPVFYYAIDRVAQHEQDLRYFKRLGGARVLVMLTAKALCWLVLGACFAAGVVLTLSFVGMV